MNVARGGEEPRSVVPDHPDQHAYDIPYHWAMGAFYRSVNDAILDRVAPLLVDYFVLEAGCGDGYMTAGIARTAKRVLGFDLSERAVAFAELIVRNPNVEFTVGRAQDIASLAKGLDRTDAIIAFEVIEHLSDSERMSFLRSSRLLLEETSGVLVLSTPNGRRQARKANPHHAHEFTPEELRTVLLEAGFKQPTITGVYLQPPFSRWAEHFADTVPFRALFRWLTRAGSGRPNLCRTLLSVCRP
jgi:2-polyprenyl-3-methyl-5-hydroxy-6-metoxy-1,4-benzoquinol methylase